MNQPSAIKRAIVTFSKSAGGATGVSAFFFSDMPETPGLNLPEGKISTATRKRLLPYTATKSKGEKKKRAIGQR
jgi:hypothetical protein